MNQTTLSAVAIPQQIDSILEQRKQRLPEIEAALDHVRESYRVVSQLEAYRSKQTDLPDEAAMQLAPISTTLFYQRYEQSVHELEKLQQRFSRDEIKISFVGRARQGKSKLLQAISGLGNNVIPSSSGSFCTGTRSIISNISSDQNPTVRAEIEFFTEREYVDNVNAYLKAIFKERAQQVNSMSEIAQLDLAGLKAQDIPDNQRSRLPHLESLIAHAHDLQSQLGTNIVVGEADIESYVAKYNSQNPEQKYYMYLGVKQANIHARFPYSACGRIVLVDTIGTGDTAMGVEEEMLDTVVDSDVIILMLRPEPLAAAVYNEDFELVSAIADAVSPDYTKKMLFWVLNRVENGPGKNVDKISSVQHELEAANLSVSEYLSVDCANQNDVDDNLLYPILSQMSANMASIDDMILKRANEQLQKLEAAFHAISNQVRRAVGASVNKDIRKQFDSKIEYTIGEMSDALRDLYEHQNAKKDNNCVELQEAATEKLKNIVRTVPSRETVLRWLNDGTLAKYEVLALLGTQIRLQIINDFLNLNAMLRGLVDDMKQDVMQVLAKAGCLQTFVGADMKDPKAWLLALHDRLDTDEFPLIRKALEPLIEFDLRMENFLIYKVRSRLGPIDWVTMDQLPPLVGEDKGSLASQIDSHLRRLLEEVYDGISEELDEYYTFPNTALFAVLRDFYDRAVWARSAEGMTVKTEWRYLLGDNIPLLWPSEYQQYLALAGRAAEWSDLTRAVQTCAEDGYFLIGKKGA